MRTGRDRPRGGRSWIAVLVLLVLLPAVAWSVAQGFELPVVWKVIAAAVAAIIPIIGTELIERFRRDDDQGRVLRAHLHFYSRRGIPKVSAVKDLTRLNVTVSRRISGDAHPPYVPRDRDGQLDDLLDTHRFVLLVGESKAGKTRMAAEAIRRKFPDRRLVFPIDAESVTALLGTGLDLRDSVIWLDEIQRYLHQGGLAGLLDHLQGPDAPTGVTVIGTIREQVYAGYGPDGALDSPYATVLRQARRLRIERLLSPAEQARAASAFTDRQLLDALDRYGLAEYLAAGPDLVDRFEGGLFSRTVGAVVVLVVADWQRTGVTRPIPVQVLRDLIQRYAQSLRIPAPSAQEIDQAVDWASKPVSASSSLVSSTGDGLAVFDYVLDYVSSEWRSAILDETWRAALAVAGPEDAFRIGLAANDFGRADVGVLAFEIAVAEQSLHVDGVLAAYNYALMLERTGRAEEALESYRKAAESGHIEAAYAAGRLILAIPTDELIADASSEHTPGQHTPGQPGPGQGTPAGDARHRDREAEPLLLMAARAGHTEASFALGELLHDSRPDEALRWLGQAAGSGHAAAAYRAGGLAQAAGHETDAAGFYLLAAQQGHPAASYELGLLLRDRLPDDALRWLGQAAESGHVEAAYAAGRLATARNAPELAERFFQLAAQGGDVAAVARMHPAGSLVRARSQGLLRRSGPAARRYEGVLGPVAALESLMRERSDDELRALTGAFRRRLADGEQRDALLPEAFATVREAAYRVTGDWINPVQLVGGVALHFGQIAEMRPGEGRALTALLPAYLNALGERSVHLLAVDDADAFGQVEQWGAVLRFLGLTTGLIVEPMPADRRRAAYACDVTYGTATAIGFDHLRDHMVWNIDELVGRGLHYAVVFEADLQLIDDARQTCTITGPNASSTRWFTEFARIARLLRSDVDYTVDRVGRRVVVEDDAIRRVESMLGIDNLYAEVNLSLVAHLELALRAKELYQRDVHYVVRDGMIVVRLTDTGMIDPTRTFDDGLHQALQAEEGLEVTAERTVLAHIERRSFLRRYDKLAGLTGTASTDTEAFRLLYGLDVVVIPPAEPVIRIDNIDIVYRTAAARLEGLVDLITRVHGAGQPVLVDIDSADRANELTSALTEQGLRPRLVLGVAEADAVLRHAGAKGALTVAVNAYLSRADIRLGGPDADAASYQEVFDLGGLAVIGAQRRTTRRPDNRLRDLAGRRGEPGTSTFLAAYTDALMAQVWMFDYPGGIDSPLLSRALATRQRQYTDVDIDRLRKDVRYDQVVERQRDQVYELRRAVLRSETLRPLVLGYLQDVIDAYVLRRTTASRPRGWDLTALNTDLRQLAPVDILRPALPAGDGPVDPKTAGSRKAGAKAVYRDRADLAADVLAEVMRAWQARITELGEEVFYELERQVLLAVIDRKWREHLEDLNQLLDTVTLESVIGRDPYVQYQRQAAEIFEQMHFALKEETIGFLFNLEVQVER